MKCQRCGNENVWNSIGATCSLCGASIGSEGSLIGGSEKPRPRGTGKPAIRASRFRTLTDPLGWIFNTLHASLTRPAAFFAPLRTQAFPREALLYGLVIGSIGTVLMFIMNYCFPPSYYSFFSKSPYYSKAAGISSAVLVMTPVVLVIQFLFMAGYAQLMLLITGSRKNPFSHTFCVMCYAGGAAVFQWIPVAGPLAALAAWFYLALWGLHTVHGISKVRAFMVLVLPMVLLFVLFVFIALAVILIAAVVGGSHANLLQYLRH